MEFKLLEKIASGEEEVDSLEKVAAYYDEMGRELFWNMLQVKVAALEKTGRKLPPGMFSGKAGIAKLLGLGGAVGGAGAIGHQVAQKKGKEDDVMLANKAYQMGMRRGAEMVIKKLQGQG